MGRLTNNEIAHRLREIRTLMEFAGEPFFKFMAYERAAETIENAPPVGGLLDDGSLTALPGVGKTIAGRIGTIAQSGSDPYLDELRARYPSTLLEVLAVQGVGMKTAQQLFERLGVASLADLERALDAGSLTSMPRLGAKSIENIRRGVLAYKGRTKRTRSSRFCARRPLRPIWCRPAASAARSRPSAISTSSAPRRTQPR